MFQKLLVANRGEIAVRVLQTCAEMGIRTVAVYSEADAQALHVRRASESYCIGPAPAAESYLCIEKIIAAAHQSSAEAVHPGYGFLAESPRFAEACRAAGLVFVGPPPEAMRLLGNKRAARQLARTVGVPVVPGYDGDDQSDAALVAAARELGFPLLIKATAAAGGRGMRLVRTPDELPEALASARREALAAFGDATVLLERVIAPARHVEVQVLADMHGHVVALGERDCSVQRRHQKVIEESPAPGLSPATREALASAAVALLRAAGYVNAGTVEFLVDPAGTVHFLEVNTRLQVEHPVTELVTGMDLVREQVRIAAGLPLSFTQENVRPRGHAIECRIYAEDPARGFLPCGGRLLLFEPPQGAGIRNDVGVETGDEVSTAYDPLLAKLIVHAPDRAACIARMLGALRAYTVLGVTTNLPLLQAVLDSAAFRNGKLSTDFLEMHPGEPAMRPELLQQAMRAAAGWPLCAGAPAPPEPRRAGPWRLGGQGIVLHYRHCGRQVLLTASKRDGTGWVIRLPTGEERSVAFARVGPATLLLREGAQTWNARVVETADALHVGLDGHAFVLEKAGGLRGEEPARPAAAGVAQDALQAPLPGRVVKVAVREGEAVDAGQLLVVLEAMKMEHTIMAPRRGVVARVRCAPGDHVPAGAALVELAG